MFKKFRNKFTNTVNGLAIKAQTALTSKSGEGYVDSGVKILIAVVIGALLLGLLYTLTKTTIMGTVSSKIAALFNFTGSGT